MPPLEHRKILIIGAGPTGLGAAHRLTELGLNNYRLVESASHVGGLSASFMDDRGFTWDVGGHVLFSHYEYFDGLMDSLLRDEWLTHEREAWIWMRNRFVPYPFQHHIRYLPKAEMQECLRGLIRAARADGAPTISNLEDWIRASFGEGIARHFMLPYNAKVWAYPPAELSYEWIGERVAQLDLERVVFNILEARDDRGWGPNRTFRFPQHGGTGEIWRRLASRLPAGSLIFGKQLIRLDTRSRTAFFQDGSSLNYDLLISTIPIDRLILNSDLHHLRHDAETLEHSGTHVVGIGLKGAPPPHLKSKCWIYFPDDVCPFYRATVFSNYSPCNVPGGPAYWSLMVEVSESRMRRVCREGLPDAVIDSLIAAHMIERSSDIASLWTHWVEYGYPTPTLKRDAALSTINGALERLGVFSRGRFGSWKYEVGNQDHSLMQGVELIDRLATGSVEATLGNKSRCSASVKEIPMPERLAS